MTEISRRAVLSAGLSATAIAAFSGIALFNRSSSADQALILSASDDKDGNHYIGAWSLNGKQHFLIPVKHRAHDCCYSPEHSLAVFFARRPGTQMHIVDFDSGLLSHTIDAKPGYHFYGHGVFSKDGRYLFTTENHYQASTVQATGVIAVYDTHISGDKQFKRVGEFQSGGIGPHQLALLSDGHTLVIANGGILTHPDRHREKLNLATMESSLTYMDSRSGIILDQFHPKHHQMSIRHLAVTGHDQVIVGVQFQGEKYHDIELVLSHQREQQLQAMQASNSQWRQQNHYIASIAVDPSGRFAISTSPRGASVLLWDLTTLKSLGQLAVRDVAGATFLPGSNSFLISNGLGQLMTLPITDNALKATPVHVNPAIRWDNHMSLIG